MGRLRGSLSPTTPHHQVKAPAASERTSESASVVELSGHQPVTYALCGKRSVGDDRPVPGDDLTEAALRDVAWYEEQDEFHYQLGQELRRQVSPDRWKAASTGERKALVDEAAALMALAMGIIREAPIAWVVNLTGALEYCNDCGAIHIRREHLDLAEPAALFAGLASELRHAWQMDVIQGRRQHPLGNASKSAWQQALASYDADDTVEYTSNRLETDAERAQVYVGAGYVGEPKPP